MKDEVPFQGKLQIQNNKLQSPRRGRPLRGVLHPLRGKLEAQSTKSETKGRPSDVFKTPFTPFRGNYKSQIPQKDSKRCKKSKVKEIMGNYLGIDSQG
jgi:hypothetical protein